MRILLIMTPDLPIPPPLYGGIERVVYLLAEAYYRAGHEVTLLAGYGSDISGTVIAFGAKPAESKWPVRKELGFVWRYLIRNRKKFDVIHNFGRLIYFLPIASLKVPKVMSYQRKVSPKGVRIMSFLSGGSIRFTGCSDYCVSTGNVAGTWKTVYNAIDFNTYKPTASVDDDAPLAFLGRLDQIKGAHTAIDVAVKTNNNLIIAGNIPDTADNYAYYKCELEPRFDGRQIVYKGAVNDREKGDYLSKCKALLFPIEWEEPFGIVMIEAMACGTPVIAFKRGAVAEVVDRSTGIIVGDQQEMAMAMEELRHIDRTRCRLNAAKRFDISVIAEQYLEIFKNLCLAKS